MKSDRLISIVWILILAAAVAALVAPGTRGRFIELTRSHPYLMGMIKVGLLGTMGELLGGKIVSGRWRLRGIGLWQRALVWAFLGIVFTAVFPLFSYGSDGLIAQGLVPGAGSRLVAAFWKSLFMNIIFAFPMMVFHRFADTLIGKGALLSRWPVVATFTGIDWRNMFSIVAPSCIWFWIPAQTVTYLLPGEFRVMSAAFLAIVLGFILGMAKRLSMKKAEVA
ncbi:MAG: hypothetical protein PHD74_05870 [Candidatus Krumholzibacteria bacterium]|nr:hypothetical protein [Candidatus Krumholzibacteria bacterium]